MLTIKVKKDNISFVPVSAICGDNLFAKSENTPWYEGDSLIKLIEKLEEPVEVKTNNDSPLKFLVTDFYTISGVGLVLKGKIASGSLKVTDIIYNTRSDTSGGLKVDSIEINYESLKEVSSELNRGQSVCIRLKTTAIQYFETGDVLTHGLNLKLLTTCIGFNNSFYAKIFLTKNPNFRIGSEFYFLSSYGHTVIKVTKILKSINKITGVIIEEEPKSAKTGDYLLIQFTPLKYIFLDGDKFILLNAGEIKAAGRIENNILSNNI